MSDTTLPLRNLKKEHEYLVAIDSDGCAFDTMEIKHKECFIPNFINYWEMQAVSKFARQAWEFVNLYSRWRGVNRFPALVKTLDFLCEREVVLERGVRRPETAPLEKWIETETKLGNPALENAVAQTRDHVLMKTLDWSKAVNESVEEIVRGVPPFPYTRKSLEKIAEKADIIVCSATPGEALIREWEEHQIHEYPKVIAGQEMGNKKEILELAIQGRYDPDNVIMIGDAPGDMKAGRANGVLFFPVNPSAENESWRRFYEEAFERFLDGEYAGDYEASLVAEFERYLPETPPWETASEPACATGGNRE
ncbi:MAG: HAD hydrolase-like protein [Armatimonadetes bacterium]|nr:HAD hydrolase-like protein [Armatimonadota bacterium]